VEDGRYDCADLRSLIKYTDLTTGKNKMRIILATSLSLFFSASIYADNYLVDTDSDCKVWSPDHIGQSETITYTVKCVDGKAHEFRLSCAYPYKALCF